jgi:flagellar biosynthesis protein FliQ
MKVYNYIVILTGIILLFQILGIDTGLDNLLLLIGYNTITGEFAFSVSSFIDAILGNAGVLAGIGAGIIIGTLSRSNPENFIILPLITGTLVLFIQAFVAIINYSRAFAPWINAIFLLILAPLVIGYAISLVEFFRGTD